MAQSPESLSESMGLLREYRTRAEHYGGVLKGMESKVSRSVYRHGENLYVDGKAAVDRWLKVFIIDLRQTDRAEISSAQKQALTDAATKADAFIEYVNALLNEDQKRGWGELAKVIPDTFTALLDGGMKIWREFRGISAEKRDAMIADLEDLRWRDFGVIKPR